MHSGTRSAAACCTTFSVVVVRCPTYSTLVRFRLGYSTAVWRSGALFGGREQGGSADGGVYCLCLALFFSLICLPCLSVVADSVYRAFEAVAPSLDAGGVVGRAAWPRCARAGVQDSPELLLLLLQQDESEVEVSVRASLSASSLALSCSSPSERGGGRCSKPCASATRIADYAMWAGRAHMRKKRPPAEGY